MFGKRKAITAEDLETARWAKVELDELRGLRRSLEDELADRQSYTILVRGHLLDGNDLYGRRFGVTIPKTALVDILKFGITTQENKLRDLGVDVGTDDD